MGFRYIARDMIRHSDFHEWYASMPAPAREAVRRMVEELIGANPSYRLSPLTGPGYFMMHWLMSDLYTSLAIYLVLRGEGEHPGRAARAH